MKIDLRKDKGILGSSGFMAQEATPSESIDQSEEERIAEVMRRRLGGKPDEAEPDVTDETPSQKDVKQKPASKRNPAREFLIFVVMVAVSLYYLNDVGLLSTYVDLAKDYWNETVGSTAETVVDDTEYLPEDDEPVLSDDIFNELMPVTEDIAALADSIEDTPLAVITLPDSIYMAQDSTPEFTPVAEEPIVLSDDDILIINNRSILLMLIDVLNVYPEDMGQGHLFLKRDALTLTAPRGGEWVEQISKVLDKFVFGSFNEDYSSGNARVSSKFEIIMNAEQEFRAENLDALRLLDVLAHPFNDYLQKIIIDISRQTDDNPATFTFAGTAQEMQYVLSSWAECRCNILIRSVDIQFNPKEILVSLDVEFFNYTP